MRTLLLTCPVVDAINTGPVPGELARKTVSAQYPRGRCGDAAGFATLPMSQCAASQRAAWIRGQIIALDSGFLGVRPPMKVS